MKYKIGEKVVVKKNLSDSKTYYMLREDGTQNLHVGDRYVGDMKNFAGKTVTIQEYRAGRYVVKEFENLYLWTDEMFL